MAERNLPLFIVDESHSKDNNSCCTSEFGSINLYYGSLLFFFCFVYYNTLLVCGFFLALFSSNRCLHGISVARINSVWIHAAIYVVYYNNNFTHSKKVKKKKEIELSATQLHFYILYSTEQNGVHTSIVYFFGFYSLFHILIAISFR